MSAGPSTVGTDATAFQLAYLLVGEEAGATEAVLETIRLHDRSDRFPWEELAMAAMRRAAGLSPDRFYLRSLANLEGVAAQVDRLPVSERTALVLDASGQLSPEQIASLLRLPQGALAELLARLWRGIGAERADLWDSLLTTVPPISADVEYRIQAALAGEEPVRPSEAPIEPDRAPRRRPALITIAFAIALALLFAIRWWPKPGLPLSTDAVAEMPVAEAGPVLNLAPYQPRTAIALSDYPGSERRLLDGVHRSAEKVLQWLGEAKVLREDPAATPWTMRNAIRFRFADDDLDLWLSVPDACEIAEGPCPIIVGGASKVPLQVEQVDLGLWMTGRGWQQEFNPGTPILLFGVEGHRMKTYEVRALPELALPEGFSMEVPDGRKMLVLYQAEDGRWRTRLQPVWVVWIHPVGDPRKGEIILVDDQTGTILRRTPNL